MKTKVVYIISDIDKALAFEWISQYIDKERFELFFLLITTKRSDLQNYLENHGVWVKEIRYQGKRDMVSILNKVYSHLKQIRPNCIHSHLQLASLTGLTAAKLAGVKKRIHTRHHSSFHHVYHKKGVWIDRFINYMSTKVVAISPVVKDILLKKEKVSKKKVVLIPHGFELNEFAYVDHGRIEQFKSRYNFCDKNPIIGIVSRYTEWKGIQYTIPAFQQLLIKHPNACLLLLNARGDYAQAIKSLLSQLPSESFREIEFENDIAAAYKAMDVFIHVPIDDHSEAYGQTYVEALAAGIPSVFTISGIAHEFVKDHKNAIVVPYKNSNAIYEAVIGILNNKELSSSITEEAPNDVQLLFDVHKMVRALEELYEE